MERREGLEAKVTLSFELQSGPVEVRLKRFRRFVVSAIWFSHAYLSCV